MLDRGHAILPVKGLIHGKSRLAAHLQSESVYALNLGNVERTVRAAVEFFGLKCCLIVSPCELTCATIRKMGVRVLFQDRNDGLNAGLEYARACLRAEGVRTITILPVDLAHVSNAALRAVLGMSMGPGLAAIVPDISLHGTNLLSMPADFALSFKFGKASFGSHLKQLRAGGLDVHVADSCSLQEDIDTIEQLRRAYGPVPCSISPFTQGPAPSRRALTPRTAGPSVVARRN